MSGASENADPLATLGAYIHLNEDDWLQLLQKLTPSSINNLQQTLKRIQQQELSTPATDGVNLLPTSSQPCASSLPTSTLPESAVSQHQGTPTVMSMGIPKPTMPSVITVPPVLNVSRPAPSSMHNAIVLPSSALLISPSEPGRTLSIDPLVSVSGINRFVVTGDGLIAAPPGPSATVAAGDTFNSLNTLASAAVAVAENASNQVQWSSGIFGVSKPTTVKPTRFSTTPLASDCSTINTPVVANKTTMDGLLSSLCQLQSSDLSSQLFSTAGATGMTVYPLRMSANGSTVFLTASPSGKNATFAHGLNIIGANALRTANQVSPVLTVASTTPLISCCSSPVNTTPIPSNTVCCGSVTMASPSSVLTSTPRAKPKFKALWETSLQLDEDHSINSTLATSDFSDPVNPSVGRSDGLSTSSPILLSSGSNSSGQRQSPMLRVKSIGQTHKRLAASAASFSDEQRSPTQDGPKKLLLLCSQSKSFEDYSFSTTSSSESVLTRGLQPRISPVKTTRPDGTEASLTSSDRREVPSNRPLIAPAVTHGDPRTTTCQLAVDQDPVAVVVDSRGEMVLSKHFEGGRPTIKEEPIGEDEARRRAKRRERNRVAAARCRQRRQDQIVELQHRVGILTKTGEDLRSTLHALSKERSRLETLVHEHGLAGCTEAQELLKSLSSLTDASDSTGACADDSVDPRISSSSYVNLNEMVCTSISTTPSPTSSSFLMITNRAGTKPDPDGACSTITDRPTLTKLDIRRASQLTSLPNSVATKRQSCDLESLSNSNGDIRVKSEAPGMNISGPGPPVIITDLLPRCSPPLSVSSTNVSKLAARPSTLIFPKAATESSQLLTEQPPTTTVPGSSLPDTTASSSSDTPLPCFWPSDLQTFSPILTPSTWKLLKNLTSGSCSTPQSFILTPNFNSLYQTLSISNLSSPATGGIFSSGTAGSVPDSRSSVNSVPMNAAHSAATEMVPELGKTVGEDTGVSGDGVQSSCQAVLLSFMNCDKTEKMEDVNASNNH